MKTKNPEKNFLNKFKKAVKDFNLIKEGDRILVAVSGGPDSTALLITLVKLKEDFGINEIAVFHLNHKLRVEADEDEHFVRELVKKLKLKGFFFKKDVSSEASRYGLSVEEAGRLIRYKLIQKIMEDYGYNSAALGHNLDDFAETVVMRFITNSNFESLKGISPKAGNIIRPLIYLRKKEIIEYLNEISQPYQVDKTNLSNENIRAIIRNKVIPLFEEINPSFVSQVFKLGQSVFEFVEFLEERVSEVIKGSVKKSGEVFEVEFERLKEEHPAVRKRLFFRLLTDLGVSPKVIRRVHIEMLDSALSEHTGYELDLPGEIKLVKEAKKFLIGRAEFFKKSELSQRIFSVPGKVYLDEVGLTIKANILNSKPDNLGDGTYECVLDADKVGKVLTIRSWKRGDRMKPFGMNFEKKLQDIFVDEKLPRRKRSLVPIITAEDGRICWIVGFRISDEFAVQENTKRFLHLKAEKSEKKEGA